ncbi:uncharacterized protein [Littorina saxatilis]|uniref:uncharacterized protein n=1 Tax=Littorina saxatilis TaxID=31220 RepID=UPI0038B629F0
MNLGFSPVLLVGAAILLNDCAVDGLGHASMAAQQTQGRVEGKLDPNITELSPAPVDWYGRKKITARRRSEKDQSEVSPTPRAVTERQLNKKPTVNTPSEEGTGTPPASNSSPENKQTNNQNDPNNAVLAHGAPKVQADTYYNVSSKREGMTLIWTQNQAATATPESVRDGGRHKRSRDTYGPYGRSCQCKNCNIYRSNVQRGNLVNIAVNQPATSSSMYGTQEPCFAVNGRTSGDMRDRGNNYPNCFHSASNDNAFTWWSVDLQSEYTIAEVEVYRRTLDNYRDALRMQGIVITINGMVCYTYPTLNNKAALASIPHQQTVRCVEPLRGRHVMLQKRVGIPTENDYKFIQICEIQIYVFDKSSRRYGDPRDSKGTACPRDCLCDNFYGCSRRVLFNVAHKKMATAVCDRDSQVTVNGFVDYPSYADVRRHCITCSVSATQKKAWAILLLGVFHIYYLLVKNRHHTLGDMNELYIYIYERSERLGQIPNNWTLCNHFQGAFRTNTEKNFTCKNAPIVGVYVSIVAPPGVRLNLCEVQIIGQPVYFQDLTAVGCSRSTSLICKNPFICEQNKCKHRLGAGCSNTITNLCANGSFCDDSLCRLPLGASCKETPDSCVKHAECDASQGHLCKMSSGGPCANTGQCANVASGYVCDSLKRCNIGAGRTCSSFAVCGAGSTCMTWRCGCIPGISHIFQSDQFCSPLSGRVGSSCNSIPPKCTEDASCDTSLYCRCNTNYTIESTDFSCKLADVFKPCDRDRHCKAGQVCQNRHCKLAIGKHCFEARECVDEAICDIKVYKCLINSGRSCANNTELCNTRADCINGTCKSRLGERCEEGQDQCVEDAVCSITSDNQTRCLLEVGLTCGLRRDMCRSGAFCDTGAVCR